MPEYERQLLLVDALVNLALGALLLAFPWGVAGFFAIPASVHNFYPAILGGVLFGVGLALLIEAYGRPRGWRGLGVEGAIAINLCGATALVVWLLAVPLDIPARGHVLLWVVAVAVYGVGGLEIAHRRRQRTSQQGRRS